MNQYVSTSTSTDSKAIVFTSESIENIPSGWRARETYKMVGPDEFIEVFELAEPGKDFQIYTEGVSSERNDLRLFCLRLERESMRQVQATDTLREWRESAKYWQKHSATIHSMLAPLSQALIEDARISPGASVLDVAGGAGEPSLTIAEMVGPTGSVMCTDAVEEMVVTAEGEAQRRGLKNIEFRQCGADSLPFANNSFDAVVSRLGAMFFPDPLASMREMLRVTKPGGTLTLAVWYKSELNPFSYLVTEVVSHYVEIPPVDSDAPGAFRFAKPGKLTGILRDADAIDISERIFKFHIEAPISVEEFWAMRSETSGILREKLKSLTKEQSLEVAQEVQDKVRQFFPNNGMSFPAEMVIVSGRKAK